jgi:type II secretory pathway pseudopilin PulG
MGHRIENRRNVGFTIIETMLFLAITGALIAALLGGVGIALNNQRYNDSVQSFKSFLQGQFANLDSVINDRSDNWSCDSSAVTSQTGQTVARGQSDCFIVGTYVVINGGATTTTDVIATSKSGAPTGANDIAKLTSGYHFSLAAASTQSQELEWGTSIAWPTSGSSPHDSSRSPSTPRSIAIMMIRSPDSGTTYTFTEDPTGSNQTDPANVKEADIISMMVAGNVVPGQGDRLICLDSNGLSTSGNMGFYIESYATNASAIQTRSNDTKQVGGDASC